MKQPVRNLSKLKNLNFGHKWGGVGISKSYNNSKFENYKVYRITVGLKNSVRNNFILGRISNIKISRFSLGFSDGSKIKCDDKANLEIGLPFSDSRVQIDFIKNSLKD